MAATIWNAADCGPSVILTDATGAPSSTPLVASDILVVIGVAVDRSANKLWFYNPLTARWNSGSAATQDPATGVGGFDISYITGSLFPAYGAYNTSGDSTLLIGSASQFQLGVIPSGFTALDTLAGSTTTWNPSDKNANITLSAGNTIATGTGASSGNRSVRATNAVPAASKAYFELVALGVGNNPAGVAHGVANASQSLVSYPGSDLNSFGYAPNGSTYKNGIPTSADTYTTYTAASPRSVRATNPILAATALKWYFETTLTAQSGTNIEIGVASYSAALTTWMDVTSGIDIQPGNGHVNRNSTNIATQVAMATGTTLGVAVDTGLKKIWFWNSATNTWDGNGTDDPATGTGGYDLSAVQTGGDLYPALTLTGQGQVDKVTANFGATAFVNTSLPSGFSSWDTGAAANSVVVNARVTATGAEVWGYNTAPSLRVTQAGAEVWGSNTAPPLRVTQAGAEVWLDISTFLSAGGASAPQPIICVIT